MIGAYGNLYKVTIQVGDLMYPNMHIIASDEFDVPFHIIICDDVCAFNL